MLCRNVLSRKDLASLWPSHPYIWIPLLCCVALCIVTAWGPSAWAQGRPSFAQKSRSQPIAGQRWQIFGQIENNDDLDDVYLFYRIKGQSTYTRVGMKLYEGIKYKATIPAARVKTPRLEFYIAGSDVNQKLVPLLGSAASPVSLAVGASRGGVASVKSPTTPEVPVDPNLQERLREEEKVFSAARKEQRIQKAPGVVTVITQADIEEGGWRNIVDLLRFSAGIDINMNGLSSPDIGIRGVNPRLSFGDKLVLLLDGHNMAWRQLNRNSLTLSIDMIKRIEIIRGPGSSLWGANALSGVINIITRTMQDLKGVHGVMGGSPLSGSHFLSLQGGQEIIKGVTFRASFSLTSDNRSPLLAPIYEFQKRGGLRYIPPGDTEYNQYFYAQLAWRGLSLSFYQSRFDAGAPLSSFSGIGGDDTRLLAERYYAKLSWLGSISDSSTLLLWASFDSFGFSPGTRYEANGLFPLPSSSALNGQSGYYSIVTVDPKTKKPQFRGYYPDCRLVGQNKVPCVQVEPRSQACLLVSDPSQTKGQTFTSDQCRATYKTGRFTREIAGLDHRFEAGVQFSTQIKSFFLSAGIDFEYLNMTEVYFPDIWPLLGLDEPRTSNVHVSGFVQLQYNLAGIVEFTGGARVDYDQQYGTVLTPRAAVVITPGAGFYAKLLYGNAFKAPSFNDLYYFRKNFTYGNPELDPESVHTVEAQIGWTRRRLLAFSVNGYYSRFSDLISYEARSGLTQFQGRQRFPQSQLPDAGVTYQQKNNNESLTTYGGEMELRLFPIRGMNIAGSFGLFFGQDGNGNALQFAARMRGSLSVSYRTPTRIPVQISVGMLYVGPKSTPATAFSAPGFLPPQDTNKDQPTPVPSWTATEDPSLDTPWYIQSYASLQFLNLFKHIDLVLRVDNLLNSNIYDASDILFRPQKRLDVMAWLRVHY